MMAVQNREPKARVPMETKREWPPGPPVSDRGATASCFVRLVVVAGFLAVGYYGYRSISNYFFRPHLVITGESDSTEAVAIGAPVRVGLTVANDHWTDGAAYAVLVLEGETEVEGPVVAVPARQSVTVPVEARLAPGWRHATLVLFDAWRENVRVDARHGIPVRVGIPDVAVETAAYAPAARAGDTLTVTVGVTNRHGAVGVRLVPIVVVLSDTGIACDELDGTSFALAAGADTTLRLELPTRNLTPAGYYLVILMSDPLTGRRIGLGLYRQPLTILP